MKRILNIHVFFISGLLFFSSCNVETAPAQEAEQEQEAGHGEEENPNVAELTEEQYQVAGIALGKPQLRNLSNTLALTGKLDLPPQNMASVTAPLGGFIRKTQVLEGTYVKKGDLLATIENPEFVTLQEDYLKEKNRLDYLELEYKRQQELHAEQVSSAKTYQQTVAEYRSVQARVQALEERLAIIGITNGSLRNGKIRRILPLHAPLEGYITYVKADVGQYVAPTDVLFRIADTEHLHVELTVFEKDLTSLKKGQAVRYSLPGESAAQREATIFLIGKEISPERTVRVHAHMEEEDKDLAPGMYVQAQVALDDKQVLSLPEAAVVQENNTSFVFLFTGEEKEGGAVMKRFRMVPVERGVEQGGFVQVALPAGVDTAAENFVIKGAYSLLSKMRNAEEEDEE
ncbi:cobalt-zinc-cadmium efflux system membrane fusion protein [Pontibacter ummariensis]|uniref:Membrane fusion protein, cobalt-zinc-cadmium efflux system n=1 Tax=Pontibacter ummariensis TaxID=1610492 RepID=A0A239JCA8_9BACT|nr:efflux RND transporter periplasmic adaptor subunit [Pontibacter ummariensis]PRY08340.1 cobalt-zinc-cadmium efflux system membrane fusion protein [Pontibacter ummariensis]SNT03058.1 membrane fusion protein, cobalt-zinc-cadmium efflux system [Pontibacter ummariensis]